MNRNILRIGIFLGGIFSSFQSTAQTFQQVLGTAGKVQSNSTLLVESNVGEVFTTSYLTANNFITQGFLQPKKTILVNPGTGTISSGNTATQFTESSFSVQAFPNPFESIVVVEQSEERTTELTVYDCMGKVVAQHSFTGLQTRIELSDLVIGSYKLVFRTNTGELGSIHLLKF